MTMLKGEQRMKACGLWLQVLLVGGLWASTGQTPDAEALIRKYGEYTERFETVSYNLEATHWHEGGKDVHALTYYSQGSSKQWIGSLKAYTKDETYNPGRSTQVITIFNEEEERGVVFQMYNEAVHRPRTASMFSVSRAKALQSYVETPAYGGVLTGRLYGSSGQSICELLRGASRPTVHSEAAKILGHDAYLVEADTQYGHVRAWISPDLGYSCLKWELSKAENQFYRGGVADRTGATSDAAYEATKVDQIGGLYVVTEARFDYEVTDARLKEVISHSSDDYKVTNITFNPDYESAGAFKIQLPEDTIVYDRDFPAITYRWRNGRLQTMIDDATVAEIDSAVEGLAKDRDATLLAEDATVESSAQVDGNAPGSRNGGAKGGKERRLSSVNTINIVCGSAIALLVLVAAAILWKRRTAQ